MLKVPVITRPTCIATIIAFHPTTEVYFQQYQNVNSGFICEVNSRVFPILQYLIGRISLIQLESVWHDWRLLKVFMCLSLTADFVTLLAFIALLAVQSYPRLLIYSAFFVI